MILRVFYSLIGHYFCISFRALSNYSALYFSSITNPGKSFCLYRICSRYHAYQDIALRRNNAVTSVVPLEAFHFFGFELFICLQSREKNNHLCKHINIKKKVNPGWWNIYSFGYSQCSPLHVRLYPVIFLLFSVNFLVNFLVYPSLASPAAALKKPVSDQVPPQVSPSQSPIKSAPLLRGCIQRRVFFCVIRATPNEGTQSVPLEGEIRRVKEF